MTTLNIKRNTSTYVQESARTKRVGANTAFLKVRNGGNGGDSVDTLVNFALPAILLAPSTKIIDATLVVYPSAFWQASATLIVSMPTKSWGGSTATWASTNELIAIGESASQALANPSATNPFRVNVKSLLEIVRGGRRYYGLRLSTNNSTVRSIRNNGGQMPTLVVNYTTAPSRPTPAAPVDGQVVDKPAPLLKLTQTDPKVTTINAIQVQTSLNGTTASWDSGTRLTTETIVDLSKTTFPPMTTQGEERWWRGRLRGSGGDWSEWTSWTRFVYETLGTVTILTPAAPPNNQVGEQQAALEWATTGFQQEFYRAILYDNTNDARLWDSGWVADQEMAVTPPKNLIRVVGREYRWDMWATDGLERTLVGDNEAYAGATRVFTYELSSTVSPVNGLQVVDMAPLPFVKLTFDRLADVNDYEIVRDGLAVDVVDVEELLQPDNTLAWVDRSAAPRRSHIWSVRAIRGGKTSLSNAQVSKTIEPAGVWLCDFDNNNFITIITDQQQTMALSEDGGIFTPLNARYGIRVTTALHGYAGSIVGDIYKSDLTGSENGQSMHDRFLRMRERKSTEMTLVLADAAYRVVPYNMTITESPEPGRNGDYIYPCSFDFIQVG